VLVVWARRGFGGGGKAGGGVGLCIDSCVLAGDHTY